MESTGTRSGTGTSTKVTWLGFDLTGVTGTLTSPRLTVPTTSGSSSGSPSAQSLLGLDVHSVPDTSWSDTTMTDSTASGHYT
jgi:hypothetical protein